MPSANRHHCQEGFYAARLTFSFPQFQLIAPNYLPLDPPSIQDQQLGLPQHLSARGSSFRMAHLKCSPTQLVSNSMTGPWSCLPSCYPCLAWGLLLAKPGSPSRWEHATISFPFFCPPGLSHRVCVPTVFEYSWQKQSSGYQAKETQH